MLLKHAAVFALILSHLFCSNANRVEIILNSPDGDFQFSSIDFTIHEVYSNYSLEKDFERIVKDRALYPKQNVKVKRNWFFSHHLNLDNSSDYIVEQTGTSDSWHRIIHADYYPIYKGRKNTINLYQKFNLKIEVKYAKSGNPNDLEFSWNVLPKIAFVGLHVTPVTKDNPRTEAVLSCFIKNGAKITIRECFQYSSPTGQPFPNIKQDIISYTTRRQLNPGLFEFALTGFAYDEQIARYIPITETLHPDSKIEIKVDSN